MRKVLLFLVVGSLVGVLLADAPTQKWRKVNREFKKVFRDRKAGVDELVAVVKKMAELNDRRAVAELLKKALFHEEFAVRKATFEGLAKTTDERAVEVIAKEALRGRDSDRQYIILKILSNIKSKAVLRTMVKATASEDWRHRCIAAEALVNFEDEPMAKNRLKMLTKDKHIVVRHRAFHSLAAMDENVKIPKEFSGSTEFREGRFLPHTLYSDTLAVFVDFSNDMETEMALPKEEIERILKEEKEKEKHKRRPRRKPKEREKEEERSEEERKEEEYREKFVVTRLEYVKGKVLEFLTRLPEGVKVKLYRISTSVVQYSKKPVTVTEDELKNMREFLDEGLPGAARNWVLAMREAFADRMVDTVLLVGCGGPYGSIYDNYEEFIDWFDERNWMRGLRVYIWGVRADYRAGFLSDVGVLKWNKKNNEEVAFLRRFANMGNGGCGILDHRGKVPVPAISAERESEKKKKEEEKKESEEK